MALGIVFNMINTGNLNTSCSISVGETSQFGWAAHGKRVFGISARGLNMVGGNFTLVMNPNLMDSQIVDPDVFLGATLQQL